MNYENGVKKKTQKTPREQIKIAKERRNDYIERVEKMKTLQEFLEEQLKDPEFRKEYEAIQPEMAVIRALVAARVSQKTAPEAVGKV